MFRKTIKDDRFPHNTALVLASTGFAVSAAISPALSAIPVALVTGFALNNTALGGKLGRLQPGVDYAGTTLLRAGIVCVGLKLSLVEVAQSGAMCLPVVAATVGSGLVVIPRLARAFDLSPRLSALLAAGTSICGVTAIVTLAPLINASQREIAVATANVVAFGLGGMLLYPVLAEVSRQSMEKQTNEPTNPNKKNKTLPKIGLSHPLFPLCFTS
jgi:uncharacterized integral membrane protein (TIGR00698 family)